MKNLCFYLGIVATWVSAYAAHSVESGSTSYFSTPVRVLLARSTSTAKLTLRIPAAVRINGVIQKAKLLPGELWLDTAPQGKLQIVRIPYQPLLTQTLELIFPQDSAAFEFEKRPYRGRVVVSPERDRLTVVNVLPLEHYLAGCVGAEMNAAWPVEALKAQAIAARSYALYRLQHPRQSQRYDLFSDTEDQVYAGYKAETPLVWKAVRDTESVYLSQAGRPASIHYHSRCGGKTDTASDVWGGSSVARTKSVPCTFCQRNPFRWSHSMSKSEFIKKMGLDQNTPLALGPIQRSSTGRVRKIELFTKEKRVALTGDSLRKALGYQNLKSALFQTHWTDAGIEIQGAGMGHGVGMCQWGAKHMADLGQTGAQILAHFYPELSLAGHRPPLFAGVR
jgi:stage II sporulation protein D